ncbi:hypothetical protein V1509DRAFT_649031 [Lipomyces kononenkoae]
MAVPKITGMLARRVTRDILSAFTVATVTSGYYWYFVHLPYIGRLKFEESEAAELRKLKPYLYGYPSPPKPESWPPYPAFPA